MAKVAPEKNYKIVRTVTFPHAFEKTLSKFEQLIEEDSRVVERIPERYRKHGLFSPAIARLIDVYVQKRWPEHVAKQNQQLAQPLEQASEALEDAAVKEADDA